MPKPFVSHSTITPEVVHSHIKNLIMETMQIDLFGFNISNRCMKSIDAGTPTSPIDIILPIRSLFNGS